MACPLNPQERGLFLASLNPPVRGTQGDDVLSAAAEGDRVLGLGGDDALTSLFNRTLLDGGPGDDTVTSNATAEAEGDAEAKAAQIGGPGDDTMNASATAASENGDALAAVFIGGGRGDDAITARAESGDLDTGTSLAANCIDAGAGNDSVEATAVVRAGNIARVENELYGGSGDDSLTAFIDAVATNDVFGVNRLYGGGGNDVLHASATAFVGPGTPFVTNILEGGAGDDSLTAFARAIADEIPGGLAENRLDGGQGDDVLFATVDENSIGLSTLLGGAGDDRLTVEGGQNNVLDGGRGEDVLAAGDGDDFLTGGMDADTFVFDVAEDQGTDTLPEFDGSEDRLAFLNLADQGAPGLADDLDAITTVTDEGAGQNVIVEFTSGTTLVFLGLGTGSVDSIADLVDDPATQLLNAVPGV